MSQHAGFVDLTQRLDQNTNEISRLIAKAATSQFYLNREPPR